MGQALATPGKLHQFGIENSAIRAIALYGDQAQTMWPLVQGAIEKALTFSQGELTSEDLRQRSARYELILWVVWDSERKKVLAVATTEVTAYPTGQIFRIITLGGEHFNIWGHLLLEAFQEYCRSHNIKIMEAVGRKGLQRLLAPQGFEPVYVVYRREV